MATDVTLYIGTPPNYAKFRFTDTGVWEGVRSQIMNAMKIGKGTIEIEHTLRPFAVAMAGPGEFDPYKD